MCVTNFAWFTIIISKGSRSCWFALDAALPHRLKGRKEGAGSSNRWLRSTCERKRMIRWTPNC